MISMIWAMDRNGLIGTKNTLPWNSSEDRKFFVKHTLGKSVVCGWNTFKGLPNKMSGRNRIVVSHHVDTETKQDDDVFVNDFESAITHASNGPEIVLIGGREIYKAGFPIADRIYVTIMHEIYDGDVYIDAKIRDFVLSGCPGWHLEFKSTGKDGNYFIYAKNS